jgi:hypothetical protein
MKNILALVGILAIIEHILILRIFTINGVIKIK